MIVGIKKAGCERKGDKKGSKMSHVHVTTPHNECKHYILKHLLKRIKKGKYIVFFQISTLIFK